MLFTDQDDTVESKTPPKGNAKNVSTYILYHKPRKNANGTISG
jgi:hypothetical protein